MLSIMREHASSWIIKVLLFAIVVVFVFWGVGSFRSRKASRVAQVNGEWITIEEYQQSYNSLIEQYRQRFGNSLNEGMIEMLQLKRQAMDQLINQRLLLHEAKKLGIRVTDAELAESIQEIPAFQSEGVFNNRQYQTVLSNFRMTPEQFEISQRNSMLTDKIRSLVTTTAKVSDAEAKEWYDWNNATVNIEYVVFEKERYSDLSPSDEELKEYFESNKEQYKTQKKLKARYVKVDPDTFKSSVVVNEDEIKEYYESKPEEFSEEKTVEARHILIKLANDAEETMVEAKRQKALEVMKLIDDGGDFAELAKIHSEGPSKDRGGALGAFKRSAMVKPFADKAFSMKAGEISEPVRTQFGWHIIKVEKVNEASTTAFEEASPKIKEKLTADQAKNLAYDKAMDIYDNSFEGDDLIESAKEENIEVLTTEYFTRSGPEQGIKNRNKFANVAFELSEMQISDIQDFDDGFYLIQVTNTLEPQIPEFDSVAQKVKEDLIKQMQSDKAKEEAEVLLNALVDGQSFIEAGEKFALEPKTTGFFKRNDSIPDIGFEQEISRSAFLLNDQKKYPDSVIKGTKGYYVISFVERKIPSDTDFESEKESVKERLIQQKEFNIFNSWLDSRKAQSNITIQEEFLN